jgi:hypothetical protein
MGDNPAWAAPGFDDSGWEQLTTDQSWGAQGHYAEVGFGWYRRPIALPAVPGASADLALLIPAVDDAYELYWNGKLVGRNGTFPPHASWYESQPAQTFGLGAVESGVLAVRVWKSPLSSDDPGELGGFEAVPELGSPESIASRKAALDFEWLRGNQVEFGLTSLYALLALLSLAAWLRDRRQWLLFWMAGYTGIPLVHLVLLELRLPWTAGFAEGIMQLAISLQDVCLWFVLLWLLRLNEHRSLARFVRIAAVVFISACSLQGLVTLAWGSMDWARPLQIADAALTATFTPLEAIPLVLVAFAVLRHKRLEPARWLVAICSFIAEMTYVARNLAGQFKRFTHLKLEDQIIQPVFTLNGNPITVQTMANTLMLLAIVYAVYRYLVESRRRQVALEQEMRNARELQQVLVPEPLPVVSGFAVTSAYRPALEVGGDFFQIVPLEGGATLVVLGDVSGKGLKAAMTVSLIVGVVRALANIVHTPAQLLFELNQRLCGRLQGGFTTCIALRIEPGRQATIANAGHLPPFLNDTEVALPGALPLGIDPEALYEETTLGLGAGDRLALYTDGLLEARSHAGELYGFGRLAELFAARPSASQAAEAAVAFGQDDDITVLILTSLDPGEESTAQHSTPELVET